MFSNPRHSGLTRSILMGVGCVLIALVTVTAAHAQAVAPDAAIPAPPDSAALASGTGLSYWGLVPPAADSTAAAFDNRSRKAWEWVLIVPYSVINLPLRWIRMGTGAGVAWLDDHNLFRYLNIVPVPDGFVPGVDYSQIEGLGGTLIYYNQLWSPDNLLRIRATYSTKQWQKYTIGTILNHGHKTELHLGGGYRLRPDLRFYGIGPNSSVDDKAFFTDERAWVGANVRRHLRDNLFVALLGTFSSVVARDPGTDDDSLQDKFPNVPPGYRDQSQGVLLRVASAYTSAGAGNLGDPQRGTIVGGTVGGFTATDGDDETFLAYRFEFQQFIPLWHDHRTLGIRAYINWIDSRTDATVPFQRMFINEMPDQFRGFDSSRWRDRGITGVTLEYRFPLMADKPDRGFGIDTVLLTDIGQVFGEFSDIKRDNLTYSYGFGFRSYLTPSFLGTLEFVWSDDGFQFRISTKQLFQFTRDVLYSGREETLIH